MAQQLPERPASRCRCSRSSIAPRSRIQEVGGRRREVMHAAPAPKDAAGRRGGSAAACAPRSIACDADAAERAFAALVARRPSRAAYDALQHIVQEDINVHRVVLAWRVWETLPITGDGARQRR